jgi:hypothetical protein
MSSRLKLQVGGFMELNGLSNLYITICELAEQGYIPSDKFEILESQIFNFKAYIHALKKNPSLRWHEFIAAEDNDTVLDWAAIGINPDSKE